MLTHKVEGETLEKCGNDYMPLRKGKHVAYNELVYNVEESSDDYQFLLMFIVALVCPNGEPLESVKVYRISIKIILIHSKNENFDMYNCRFFFKVMKLKILFREFTRRYL